MTKKEKMQSQFQQFRLITKVRIAVGIFALIFIVAVRLTSEGLRKADVIATQKKAEAVSQLLAQDKRFEGVTVSASKKGNGALYVKGVTHNTADFTALKDLIWSNEPFTPINWQVQIISNTSTPGQTH